MMGPKTNWERIQWLAYDIYDVVTANIGWIAFGGLIGGAAVWMLMQG